MNNTSTPAARSAANLPAFVVLTTPDVDNLALYAYQAPDARLYLLDDMKRSWDAEGLTIDAKGAVTQYQDVATTSGQIWRKVERHARNRGHRLGPIEMFNAVEMLLSSDWRDPTIFELGYDVGRSQYWSLAKRLAGPQNQADLSVAQTITPQTGLLGFLQTLARNDRSPGKTELTFDELLAADHSPPKPAAAPKQGPLSRGPASVFSLPPKVRLYDPADLQVARERAEHLDKEQRRRLLGYLDALEEQGDQRQLKSAPAQAALETLKLRFPHMEAIIDDLHLHLQLARLSNADHPKLAFPPMLLVGDPGVGKTFFAKALAKMLQIPYFQTDLASQSAGFILAGLDMSWSNGKPGLVYTALAESRVANPMILIDEIDKGQESRHDPLGPLYGLLEPGTARGFRDEAVPVEMDASHILWVATANDRDGVPPAILSRLTEYEIPLPTPEQGRQIAAGVWSDLLVDEPWGSHFQPEMDEEIADLLARQPPRLMRKLLVTAAARASNQGRWGLSPGDIRLPASATTRRMGF